MIKLIARRILVSIFLVFGLLTVTFIIIRLAPGDPSLRYLSPEVKPEIVKQIKENYGLNEPISTQYFKWLGLMHPYKGVIQGDFGYSFSYHKPVLDVIKEAIPNTLLLTISAIFLNFFVGIILGIYSAYNENKKSEKVISTVSVTLYSLPDFWVSLLLIVLFSLVLGWLPSSQIKSIEYDELSSIGKLIDLFKHLILPVIVLGVFSSASTIKYMKGSLSEILNKDYILFARMNGLSERKIFFNHVFRNSLNPIFTIFGLYFPLILGSSAVIEYVFALPGLGRIGIDSIFSRDYPVIIAITFIAGIMVAIGNIIADLLIIINDPRIRKTK